MAERDPSLQDLRSALAVVRLFLDALRARDEDTITSLVYPPSVALWGAEPGLIGARFRELWPVSDDSLAMLAPTSTARLIPPVPDEPDLVAFGLARAPWGGGAEIILSPTRAAAIALIRGSDGSWLVWGTPDADEFAAARLIPLEEPPTEPQRDSATGGSSRN